MAPPAILTSLARGARDTGGHNTAGASGVGLLSVVADFLLFFALAFIWLIVNLVDFGLFVAFLVGLFLFIL